MKDMFDEQSQSFSDAISAVAVQGQKVVDVFVNQTHDLIQASERASEEAKKVRMNTFEAGRDDFLRASRTVMDDLNSLGIDMVKIIDKPLAEKLWNQFSRGDKGVFLRAIFSGRETRKVQEKIRGLFNSDPDFRKHVEKYLERFEHLLSQAGESDPGSILSSAFVTSDVGKVYVLLSRAVGRMD
jgi:hypothetical protein